MGREDTSLVVIHYRQDTAQGTCLQGLSPKCLCHLCVCCSWRPRCWGLCCPGCRCDWLCSSCVLRERASHCSRVRLSVALLSGATPHPTAARVFRGRAGVSEGRPAGCWFDRKQRRGCWGLGVTAHGHRGSFWEMECSGTRQW